MTRSLAVHASLLLAAAALPLGSARAALPTSGTYLCKAGSSRMMLTLGELTLSGNRFRFHAPTGADTEGTVEERGSGLLWHGDIGAITNDQIVESARAPNSPETEFYFTYRARPTSSPTSTSCSLVGR